MLRTGSRRTMGRHWVLAALALATFLAGVAKAEPAFTLLHSFSRSDGVSITALPEPDQPATVTGRGRTP